MAKYLTKFTDQAAWEAGDKDFPNVSLLDNGDVKYMAVKPPYQGKALLTYNDGTEYEIVCNTSTTLTSGETNNYKTNATKVEIGSCTTKIGKGAFAFATWSPNDKLKDVIISSGVTELGLQAFAGNKGLSSFTFEEGSQLTSIGAQVFSVCSGLTSITIPSGITSIGNGAFDNCRSLTSITCLATTPPILGSDVFRITNDCPIMVPAQSVEAYKSAPNWNNYASRIQAIQ